MIIKQDCIIIIHCITSSCTVCRSWPSTPWTPAPRRGRPQCSPPKSRDTLQTLLQTLQTPSLSVYNTWAWRDLVCLSCPSSLFQVHAHPRLSLLQILCLHSGRVVRAYSRSSSTYHDTAAVCICNDHKSKNKIQVPYGENFIFVIVKLFTFLFLSKHQVNTTELHLDLGCWCWTQEHSPK